MIIDDIQIAMEHTVTAIKKKIFSVLDVNHKRHKFIHFKDGSVAYFMFKREYLHKWIELYPSLQPIESQIQYVDSINVQLFYNLRDHYLQNKFKEKHIIICYSDGTILKIRPEEWLKRASEYGLYRKINALNFEKKDDYSGKDDFVPETVISCFFTQDEVVDG